MARHSNLRSVNNEDSLRDLLVAVLMSLIVDNCQDENMLEIVDELVSTELMLPRLPFKGDSEKILEYVKRLKSGKEESLPGEESSLLQQIQIDTSPLYSGPTTYFTTHGDKSSPHTITPYTGILRNENSSWSSNIK